MFDFTAFLDFYFTGFYQHVLQPVQFFYAIPDPLDGSHLSAPLTPDTFGHCNGSYTLLIRKALDPHRRERIRKHVSKEKQLLSIMSLYQLLSLFDSVSVCE